MPRQYSILGSQRNKSEIPKHKAEYCGGKNALIYDLHHTKIGLTVFLFVILKGGLANTNPAKPLFGMRPTIELHSVIITEYIVSVQARWVSGLT